jgi:hypothetical protein
MERHKEGKTERCKTNKLMQRQYGKTERWKDRTFDRQKYAEITRRL